MNDYGVVLFYGTSAAVRSEKLAQQAGLKVRLIPVPRQFSSECGLALRFDWAQLDALRACLEQGHVEIAAIHHL